MITVVMSPVWVVIVVILLFIIFIVASFKLSENLQEISENSKDKGNVTVIAPVFVLSVSLIVLVVVVFNGGSFQREYKNPLVLKEIEESKNILMIDAKFKTDYFNDIIEKSLDADDVNIISETKVDDVEKAEEAFVILKDEKPVNFEGRKEGQKIKGNFYYTKDSLIIRVKASESMNISENNNFSPPKYEIVTVPVAQ